MYLISLLFSACAPHTTQKPDAPVEATPPPVPAEPSPSPPEPTPPTAGAAATPAPELARAELDAGIAALQSKRPDDAIAALTRCVEADPTLLECRWQLGWGYWVKNDFERVVSVWEALAALDPGYETVGIQLAAARGQVEVRRLAAAARARAPSTYVSKAPEGATLRLRAVGDMMIGTAFPEGALPPDGGASAFASVGDLLRDADVTFGNLEGPLCDRDVPSQKCKPDAPPGACYAFRTPTSYMRWYKEAGFDVVSTANNHAVDFGEECRLETEQALEAAGILFSGRPGTFARWETNGLKVALVGFHTNPSGHLLTDTDLATALVRGLAAESDIVIVSFHGGAEGGKATRVPVGPEVFYGEDRGDLRLFTHAVIDAGADLVLGHGPHVLRAMEMYKGRLIAYSLGNFATYGRFNLSGHQGVGAVLEVKLARDGRFAGGRILGTKQEGEGIPAPDPANAAADLVRLLGEQDFPETTAKIAQDGTIAAP
jgi:hypothetical protein